MSQDSKNKLSKYYKGTYNNDNASRSPNLDSSSNIYSNKECYFYVEYNGEIKYKSYLPCYPDEVSESQNANWSEQAIVGRTSPLAAYTGTSFRDVSFSFDLHREMTGNENDIDNILTVLRQSVYVEYNNSGLIPPIVRVAFGDLKARGIVKSVSYNWKKPIIDKKYQLCSVSISMYDIPSKVLSATDIGSTKAWNPFGH